MALTDSEVARIKAELGYNLLGIGAVPYVGVTQLFEQVIQPYLTGGVATTSATTVAATTTATPATLKLASADGFTAGARVVVDVDDREEIVTVQSVSGATLTALFKLPHTGTYPVILEGGEAIVRGILRNIRNVQNQINAAASTAGLKRVDVLEFYGSTVQTTQVSMLQKTLGYWRDQLASTLGVANLWRERDSASQTLSNY